MIVRILILAGLALSLMSCQTTQPPYLEYNLARTAIQAAATRRAPTYSPGSWHRAEKAYKDGERAFQDSDFDLARDLFLKAVRYAERAENVSMVKQFKSGEVAP